MKKMPPNPCRIKNGFFICYTENTVLVAEQVINCAFQNVANKVVTNKFDYKVLCHFIWSFKYLMSLISESKQEYQFHRAAVESP